MQLKIKCVGKTHTSDARLKERNRPGECVKFHFTCESPPENGVQFGNVLGPWIVMPDEMCSLGEFSVIVTDPKDFDAYEVGGFYTIAPFSQVL
jgi:hypothetical protein